MQILVVEDTAVLGEALQARLQRLGNVHLAADADAAKSLLYREAFDLVVLDRHVLEWRGEGLRRAIRKRRSRLLLLTAEDPQDWSQDEFADAVLLRKPFDFADLEARCLMLLQTRLKFSGPLNGKSTLTLDRSAKVVLRGNIRLPLKEREYQLLDLFISNLGNVLSQEQIAHHLFPGSESRYANQVDLYVQRLRQWTQDTGLHIRIMRGLGYLAEAHHAA